MAMPSRRPAAPDEVITESAPLWCRRCTFSSSRTDATIVIVDDSSRAVSVARTDVSSRLGATTIARALRISASSSTPTLVALPATVAKPSACAARRASGSVSMTTIASGSVPRASSVFAALRPWSRSRR